jgi:hypothetical protein
MEDLAIAVALATVFSVLICCIEVKSSSKAGFRECLTGAAVLYLLVLLVGNVATTLLAAATTGKFFVDTATSTSANTAQTLPSATVAGNDQSTEKGLPATPTEPTSSDKKTSNGSKTSKSQATKPLVLRFPWFWYAFLGVFGFEALLQNINVTFFGQGVLAISDWINKARDGAVAAAIESQTNTADQGVRSVVNKLKGLPEADLNAYVLNALGKDRLNELQAAAQATGADTCLTKALALAYEAYDKVAAIQT